MTNTAGETNVKPWTPDTAQFGTRLAMVRQRMGWNLTEASVKCGLGQNDWARYEDGRSPRKLDEVVAKIADSTGVDRAWLMWGAVPGGGTRLYGITPTKSLKLRTSDYSSADAVIHDLATYRQSQKAG